MARAVTVKAVGFKELEKALGELSRATRKNVAKRALMQAAKPIARQAAGTVRRRTGTLADSIKVVTPENTVGKAEYAAAMSAGLGKGAASAAMRKARRGAPGQNQVTVLIATGQLPQATMIEFGTSKAAPYPYMRPAWDSGKAGALDDITRALESEIAKAAARVRAKALKAKKV